MVMRKSIYSHESRVQCSIKPYEIQKIQRSKKKNEICIYVTVTLRTDSSNELRTSDGCWITNKYSEKNVKRVFYRH